METSQVYEFGPFRLDVGNARLLRDGESVPLPPKTFEVLRMLVSRAGHLIEKDALMREVWPDTFVEEANVSRHVWTLRKALGESGSDEGYIETVPKRGYRFAADVQAIDAARRDDRFVAPVERVGDVLQPAPGVTVGRDAEIAELRRAFDRAAAGSGRMLSVSGEAGIGKSTLVARFLAEVGTECFALHGRCSERLAPGEPYLPVLEALEGLLRHDPRSSIIESLAARAPWWYAQVAPLVNDILAAGVPHPTGASQERQKRELGAFVMDLAQSRPVVLFLDDVHWADVSTLDLLLYLTSRLDAIRLLLVVAYRPTELLLAQDAFVQSLRDLRARRRVRELTLGFLSRQDVAAYIATEFPQHSFPTDFPALVHERTEGNPLFLVDLLRELRERGAITCRDGTWMLMMPLLEVAKDLAPSVRSLIERTIARLDDLDRQLLVAASVQGAAFDSAVIARALEIDAALVEERLDRLARVHALIRIVGQNEAADAMPNVRYVFVHVLYQHALYASLMPTRKAALSAAIGEALGAVSAEPPAKLAHQLALLLEAGGRPVEAVDAFLLAAQHAVSLSASREAAALARRGLSLVAALPATPEHLGRELQLLVTLGVPLAATTGYANPEVERTYARARDLCEELDASHALFPVLLGQWVLYHVGARFPQAIGAAEQLLALGGRTGDVRMLEVAHALLGYTRGHLGELEVAIDHLTRAESLGDPSHHPFYQSINALDPALAGLCQQGRVLCLLGHTDRAVEQANRALSLARWLAAPNAIGFALVWSGYVHQLRLEPRLVADRTEEALALAMEHGLADVRGWAAVLHAWAGDDPHTGAAIIRESLAAQRSFGSEIARPHQLGLLAELLIRAGDFAGASATLDEALAHAARTGDRYYEPELHRLKGDAAREDVMNAGGAAAVEAHYQRAVDSARRQGSRLFEQRAAAGLARA